MANDHGRVGAERQRADGGAQVPFADFTALAIFATLGGFAILAGGWFFLHKLQKRAMHVRFREFAARDEENERYERAARFLRITCE